MGELLDAALLLLRVHAAALLPVAGALAVTEQLVLAPLLDWSEVLLNDPVRAFEEEFDRIWVVLCVGAGCEAVIIALLAAPASRAAGALLLDRRLSNRAVLAPRGLRPVATVALALFAGVFVTAGSFAGPFWAVGFGFSALAVPALIVDRVNPLRAIGRGFGLASRSGGRGLWILLLGYLTWWLIRMLVGTAGGLLLAQLVPIDRDSAAVLLTGMRAAVNTLAYASLACLAATLHLETRFRTEGLDIALGRGHVAGADPLAVRR
ncbi:hypothetical protein DFJ67_0993 [Asanoa ferruginea]|uniref:Uncharacterized protein n=1 Tax=Asanoa ferruginea TaxID=53367 RepID=A0A3D9ZCQ1_9ACTN|nr:hypothetical protein [Asanoa ferruginea]REF95045.1 hypothetical protein DFJ67_0993 [Asanoa ferruginea]GIF48859.1 hypothetical protein Afe04nite_33980 [Asanoa ferruginea]